MEGLFSVKPGRNSERLGRVRLDMLKGVIRCWKLLIIVMKRESLGQKQLEGRQETERI